MVRTQICFMAIGLMFLNKSLVFANSPEHGEHKAEVHHEKHVDSNKHPVEKEKHHASKEHAAKKEHAEHTEHAEHAGHKTTADKSEHAEKKHGEETAEHEHGSKESSEAKTESQHSAPTLSFWTWVQEKLMGSLEKKWTAAMNLDMDNDFLRARVAELEIENAILIYKANSCSETQKASEIKNHAKAEGGFESSRTIASLDSRNHNVVEGATLETYEKATKAFAEEDYEVAAKYFVGLVEDKENKSFQKTETYFFAGISLYELKNFKQSTRYLKKALELAQNDIKENNISFKPRSMAWLALAYEKLGETSESKKIVHELIQKFPKSQEALRYSTHAH